MNSSASASAVRAVAPVISRAIPTWLSETVVFTPAEPANVRVPPVENESVFGVPWLSLSVNVPEGIAAQVVTPEPSVFRY